MKKKTILLFVVFVMLLNGCTYVVEDFNVKSSEQSSVLSTNTLVPTSTPTFKPTSTPTLVPTNTPIRTSTPTLVPTPIEIPTPVFTSVENDLSPSFTQSIYTEYMGVKFNLELITDSSLNPEVTKIELEDGFEHVLAAIVAADMFQMWWAKGPVPHSFDSHTIDLSDLRDEFANFMSLWARAQETNNLEDWERIQINRILANDLNDGFGYLMNHCNFWMMYNGVTPEGITSIRTFSIVFVNTIKVKNIQTSWSSSYSGDFIVGYGMNVDNDRLLVYLGSTNFRYAGEVPNGCGVSCLPAQYVLRFVPMSLTSSVRTGYKKYPNDEDRVLIFDLRDHLIVYPEVYP